MSIEKFWFLKKYEGRGERVENNASNCFPFGEKSDKIHICLCQPAGGRKEREMGKL